MKRSYEKLIKQIVNLGEHGHLGEDAKQGIARYAELPNDIARSIVYVNGFFLADIEEEARQIRGLLCQMMIVVYRDAKKRDPGLARAFANAFIEDFPQASGTALLPRWVSLAEASFAFKNLAKSENPSLVWQQASRLVLATNEFLDGLLGLLIVAWRCALGKTVNVNVLGNPYGSKVDEFHRLTNGDDGPFYLFLRMANPKLRNGIAHNSIWLDPAEQKVRYIVGQQQKIECEMGLTEFMAMAYLGSHLASAYMAALGTIIALEDGGPVVEQLIPAQLVSLYRK